MVREGEVAGADDAVDSFEEGGFKNAGEFADVSRPVVLEEASEGAGSEHDGALLVAVAESFEEGLGEGSDVFAALAQGWNGEANGGEPEGEVGHDQTLSGELAQRRFRRGKDDGAAGCAILEGFEDAEEESLAGRGEQVDAVEVGEAGESGGVGAHGEPFAGIAAFETGVGERGEREEKAGQGLFACALFAFDGGNLEVRRGHLRLHDEFAPGCAYSHDLAQGRGVDLDESESGDGRLDLELSGALHGSQRASPSWPGDVLGSHRSHRRLGGKLEPELGVGCRCCPIAGRGN